MKGPHCGADGGRQDSCGEGRPKAHLEVVTTEEGRMWSGSLDFTHELGRGLQKMTATRDFLLRRTTVTTTTYLKWLWHAARTRIHTQVLRPRNDTCVMQMFDSCS